MSRFDERAEATAERRQMDKGGPPRAEIRRVRRALTTGHRSLKNNLSSIDVLLNLVDTPNTSVESGPPAVGTYSNTQAVKKMRAVADNIRDIRAAVIDVEFDSDDKQKFRVALGELAKAWDLRADALAAADTRRAEAKLRLVNEAERRSLVARRGLGRYLPKVDLEEEGEEE
jgi:hypothetical protein